MLGARFKESTLKPRHDIVIIRKVARGKSIGGVELPEISKEGVRFIVVAVGPEVNDLKPGDEVVPGGPTAKAEFYPIPGCPDLSAIKEEYCMLLVEKETN